MAQEHINAAILGLGRSGWSIHADALARHESYRVAAVADPVPERREEAVRRFGCAAYAEPEEAISEQGVEVVIVATPSHTHVPLALAALGASRHVVVEKPMAQDTAEMDEMISEARRADRVLTCYQPRRLEAMFTAIQHLMGSGRIGRPVLLRRTTHRFQRRADWQMLRRLGGGELSNTCPHLIDQALCLLGPGPYEVFADLQHTVGAGDAEDHVKLCLKKDGVVADIESSFCVALPQPEWLIFGTQGAVSGSSHELVVRWLDPSALAEIEVDEGPAPERRYGTGEQIEWHEEVLRPEQERSPALLFYDHLWGTLREGAPVFVTPESVREQIEIIERAREQTGFR